MYDKWFEYYNAKAMNFEQLIKATRKLHRMQLECAVFADYINKVITMDDGNAERLTYLEPNVELQKKWMAESNIHMDDIIELKVGRATNLVGMFYTLSYKTKGHKYNNVLDHTVVACMDDGVHYPETRILCLKDEFIKPEFIWKLDAPKLQVIMAPAHDGLTIPLKSALRNNFMLPKSCKLSIRIGGELER